MRSRCRRPSRGDSAVDEPPARRRPAQGGSVVKRLLIAIPIILILVAMLTGAAGTLFTVAAYNYYAAGLPDPTEALTDLEFEQQTIVYDRTGEVELARLGSLKREVVTFDQIPEEMLDATTAIEDQDFWINPGFDPVGIISAGLDTLAGNPRGASTITQQLVRARLLPAEAFEDGTYERKVREIIQSIRLTQAYPGDEGKQDIITAYLNQNFYGNNSYGVKAAAKSYFGKPMEELTLAQFAILAAIPQSPTKFDLVRNAVEVCLDEDPARKRSRRRASPIQEAPDETPEEAPGRLREEPTRGAADVRDRHPARLHPRAHEDEQPADRRRVQPGRLRGREGRAGRHPAADLRDVASVPVRVAGPRGTRADPVPGRSGGLHRGRHGRLPGHDDARLGDAEDRRALRLRRSPGAALIEPGARSSTRARSPPRTARGSWACVDRTSTTPRPRSWTTAPARSSPTSAARATRPRARRNSSPSSTSSKTAGASPVRRSSRSIT